MMCVEDIAAGGEMSKKTSMGPCLLMAAVSVFDVSR